MARGAVDIAEIVPEIRDKLPDLEPPLALEPEQARFRLFDSISVFLNRAANSQPLMLVLEDLHWSDRSSLLLLVGTYRDVEVPRRHPLAQTLGSLVRGQHFLKVQLTGLTQPEVGQLIQTTPS